MEKCHFFALQTDRHYRERGSDRASVCMRLLSSSTHITNTHSQLELQPLTTTSCLLQFFSTNSTIVSVAAELPLNRPWLLWRDTVSGWERDRHRGGGDSLSLNTPSQRQLSNFCEQTNTNVYFIRTQYGEIISAVHKHVCVFIFKLMAMIIFFIINVFTL